MTTSGDKVVADGWITTAQAKELTGYHIEHVRELARAGLIDARKVTARAWLISQDSLIAYQREMETLGSQRFDPRRNPRWIESRRKE